MTRLPGDEARRLRSLAEQHLWMPYSPPGAQGTVRDEIRIMTHGQGVRTWDADGNEYLDGTSALEALILGHGDEEIVEAIAQQARTMSFVDVFRFVTPPQVELAAELVAASPGMAMAHFTPGGAEADEVAIKMARQYHALRGEPYRMKVITRQGAFHGVTAGAMALDGQYFASRNVVYDGGLSWGRTVPAGACPACDFGKASRYLACVHAIEATIEAEGPETVAAVVVDPCATAIAVSVPPAGYLRDLRAVCDRHGVLLVVDEIISGMGRTGRLFATEWDGIRPDFITLSKALSSGYVPIGATLISPAIRDTFVEHGGVFLHGHTYAGHPVAAAAALTVLRRVIRERLPERSGQLGARLLEGLRSLDHHRIYWDARGRGLLAGLEIVRDNGTGEDFADRLAAGNALRMAARDRGLTTLLLHPGNVLFVAPAVVASEADIDRMVAILDDALGDVEAAWT
ncbi:MAG TPA: aminotransferase class III-fold pyridoxal phosphate-dependent enzyme [Candidatus Deferrimicrobium sp.]|nr:aminotransferase class III-fold pyridoxal phosphate-dependent enzyme [Candidatus Deferrimicrobium sp.]